MRKTALFAIMFGTLALGPAVAGPVSGGVHTTFSNEVSSQERRPRTRLRVYGGGRLLYRDCTFRLVQEWRPSGTVIVPRMRCRWVTS